MELLVDEAGLTVYKRTYDDETIVVAINNTSEEQSVVLEEEIETGKELQGLLAGGLVKSDENGYSIRLESGQSEIFQLVEQQKDNRLSLGILIAEFCFIIIGDRFHLVQSTKRNKLK